MGVNTEGLRCSVATVTVRRDVGEGWEGTESPVEGTGRKKEGGRNDVKDLGRGFVVRRPGVNHTLVLGFQIQSGPGLTRTSE